MLLVDNWQTRPVVGGLDCSVCGGGFLATVSESAVLFRFGAVIPAHLLLLCQGSNRVRWSSCMGCPIRGLGASRSVRRGAESSWLGFGFHFVASEPRDGKEGEVDAQDGDAYFCRRVYSLMKRTDCCWQIRSRNSGTFACSTAGRSSLAAFLESSRDGHVTVGLSPRAGQHRGCSPDASGRSLA